MRYLLWILGLLVGYGAVAQSQAVIHTTTGGTVRGQLLSIDADGTMVVQLGPQGPTMTLLADQIDAYTIGAIANDKPRALWADRQWHNTTTGAVLMSDFRTGVSLDHTVHYALYRRLHAGVGLSFANYRQTAGTNIMAIYASGRAYAIDGRVSPYVDLRAGYGRPTKYDRYIESDGGLHLQARIGYKVEQRSTMMHFFVGYGQQDARYQSRTGESLSDFDIQYRRILLGVGLGF